MRSSSVMLKSRDKLNHSFKQVCDLKKAHYIYNSTFTTL